MMAEAEDGAPPARPAHDPVHRRDPPLQQGAAGRLPAARRSRRHRAHRRDDREPVVRGELGAALAVEGLRAQAARRSRPIVAILRARASSDPERGLGAHRVSTRRRGARRPSRRYANGDARIALNLLEHGGGSRPATPAGSTAALVADLAQNRALLYDKTRRGALQPDLGAAQVDAQQRSRRVGLLAGADARGRRGSALHRAAAGALRLGRHRQRRSAGARRSPSRRRTPCTSSACPKATPRWRRRRSTWRPRRRATPSIVAYLEAAEAAATGSGRAGAAAPAQRADAADEAARLREGLPLRPRRAGGRRRTWSACRRRTRAAGSTSRPSAASRRKSSDGCEELRRSASALDVASRLQVGATAPSGTSPRAAAG